MADKNEQTVLSVMNTMLIKLTALSDSSAGKAILAKLRNSVGKPLSETTDIWPILFENLPDKFLGQNDYPSDEERVILTTLQLYAIHQQSVKTIKAPLKEEFYNIGKALRQIHTGERQQSIDRRFNAMITAKTFDELVYHLRHFIKLLKAKSPETKVDYAKLADDLYWFLKGKQERVRIAWARQYYRQISKGDETHEDK